jgi:hypothetical protein
MSGVLWSNPDASSTHEGILFHTAFEVVVALFDILLFVSINEAEFATSSPLMVMVKFPELFPSAVN